MFSILIINQVEYKDQLAFEVKKSNGQPIEFQPLVVKQKSAGDETNDRRQVIYFNYDSIVDFSIGVKPSTGSSSLTSSDKITSDSSSSSSENENGRGGGGGGSKPETLNAQIEVSVNGEYDFQIVKKDTQEPIDINVKPKVNNVYKIEFQPSPVTGYTLKANRRKQAVDDDDQDVDESKKAMFDRHIDSHRGLRTNVSGRCIFFFDLAN